MNQQDEDEIIMDTLAGESSLKKILEMLEDLSKRIASIEAQVHYKPNWGTTTGTYPYTTNQPHIWYSSTGGSTTSSSTTSSVGYYTYHNSDGTETKYYVEDDSAKQA